MTRRMINSDYCDLAHRTVTSGTHPSLNRHKDIGVHQTPLMRGRS